MRIVSGAAADSIHDIFFVTCRNDKISPRWFWAHVTCSVNLLTRLYFGAKFPGGIGSPTRSRFQEEVAIDGYGWPFQGAINTTVWSFFVGFTINANFISNIVLG
jgi:hypothetical protein